MSRPSSAPDAGRRQIRALGHAARGFGGRLIRALWLITAMAGLWPALAVARAAHCDDAARQAAASTGVPLDVLRAISRVETGRARDGVFGPWPWTVNLQGRGHWFETEQDALGFVQRAYLQGARSFDVGCFQINFKWHGGAFDSLDQMLDPVENALYAARFLHRLKGRAGDWSRAAGAYHSRTPELARAYRGRFERLHAELARAPDAGRAPRAVAASANGFPLVQGGGAYRAMGSLVRLDPADALHSGARPFISMVCDTCPQFR